MPRNGASQRDVILRLREQGMKPVDIASRLSLTYSYVYRMLREAGWGAKYRWRAHLADKDAVIDMLRAGATVAEIQLKHAVSGGTISRWRREADITSDLSKPRRPYQKVTPEIVDQVRILTMQGKSYREIGEMFGKSYEWVRRVRRKGLGLSK